jgi:hypothetical protein
VVSPSLSVSFCAFPWFNCRFRGLLACNVSGNLLLRKVRTRYHLQHRYEHPSQMPPMRRHPPFRGPRRALSSVSFKSGSDGGYRYATAGGRLHPSTGARSGTPLSPTGSAGTAWPRWDGGDLQGTPTGTGSVGGPEDSPAPTAGRTRLYRALQSGGASLGALEPSQHCHGSRIRASRWSPLFPNGVSVSSVVQPISSIRVHPRFAGV